MKIHHKIKASSKRTKLIKKVDTNRNIRSASLSADILSDPYVIAGSTMAVQYVINYSINRIRTHLKRHDSPFVTKCKFILNHPEGKICGANAEILQVEIKGKQTIVHKCSEFSAHIAQVADKRKISRLKKIGKYRK
ncbi:hypothetical protein [Pseudoalteromonas maricaloris]|uniref:hypothetical protein n=1 Tax=Pseudoalteromonas maricaloris TaxID=184924 RepID=UPI00029B0425|nr:hypothetical protein [Pseudoalteromonas flavipulchra]